MKPLPDTTSTERKILLFLNVPQFDNRIALNALTVIFTHQCTHFSVRKWETKLLNGALEFDTSNSSIPIGIKVLKQRSVTKAPSLPRSDNTA